MKRFVKLICLVSVFLMMAVSAAMAVTISNGDYVELANYNPDDMAGIMTYKVSTNSNMSNPFYYNTFCIQDNVYIWPGTPYPVTLSGTVGPYDTTYVSPVDNKTHPTAGSGKLNPAVDYLFYRYEKGAYNAYMPSPSSILAGPGSHGQTSTQLSYEADFQRLLWTIQGTEYNADPNYDPFKVGTPYSYATNTPWATDYANWLNPSKGLNHSWGTEVINIYAVNSLDGGNQNSSFIPSMGPDIQNQLYNPVPEPSTFLLVGAGLVGILLRRSRVRNNKS